ncbi:hypothetical protein DFH28DRAFT_975278 [Melampsora americana]|nr:hypothetical protein DFH28DRAFT_975278 [Melampsora americana]
MNTLLSAKGVIIALMSICVLLQGIVCPRVPSEFKAFVLRPGETHHGLSYDSKASNLVFKEDIKGYTALEIQRQDQGKKFTEIQIMRHCPYDIPKQFINPKDKSIKVRFINDKA